MTDSSAPAIRSTCAQSLQVAGRSFGMIGVASPAGYGAVQQRTFAIFATQVAAAIAVAQLGERRQEMVDTLVNLRADLDRSERQRLINEERAKSAERVEHAHEAAVDALLAVSRHARTGHGLVDFYRRLTRSIAELVTAEKVLFWQLDEEGLLHPIPGGHGIAPEFTAGLRSVPCAPDRDDLASRIVFHDLMFRASRADESSDYQYVLDTLGVANAVAVPWRAGEERLGLVAAYDSTRPGGFSREDAWVLHTAGLASGQVTRLWHAQEDLRKSVDRLTKVDSARQLLLKNMTTVVEKERKRFVTELHDDALQKLTAAELHVGRLSAGTTLDAETLESLYGLLEQTETSLRRLVFEVRPPALESPDGLAQSIGDRVAMLSGSGIGTEMEVELPEDLSLDVKTMVFRQVAEAIGNVERHSQATHVKVLLRVADGGVHGVVEDNGLGFVVAERSNLPGHLGLLALRERALMAGGWYKIESQPGFGSHIEFWIPLGQ